MARVSHKERFVTSRAAEECFEAARRILALLGAETEPTAGPELVGKLGSQAKTTLLGAWFVSGESLPIKVRIKVQDQGEHRELQIIVEEALALGTIATVEGKYRARCQQIAVQVLEACTQRLM